MPSTDSEAHKRKQIPSLNGLRALSILMVLVYHIDQMGYVMGQEGYLYNRIPVITNGQFGVNVFFLISGFLITTLLLGEEARTGTISFKNFFLKRVLRIFPVYYTLLGLYLVLQLCGVLHFITGSWITSLTYTKYLNHSSDWETGHLWSLSIEEQFYLFWPLAFLYSKRLRRNAAFVVIILVPIFRMLYVRTRIPWMDDLTIFQRVDSIMWGCIFAMYHQQIWAWCHRLFSQARILVLLPFVMIFALDIFTRLNHVHEWHMGALITSIGGITGTISDVCIGVIMLISIHYTKNLWFAFLNYRVMNHIGMLSYSIYIWQQLFFSTKIGIAGKWPLNIILIFAVAHASFYLIEQPFLKLKGKLKIG